MEERAQDFVEQAKNVNVGDVAERVNDISERVESGLNSATRELKSRMKRFPVSESTIPNAFSGMPKMISPRVHAWLDVAVTGYFLGSAQFSGPEAANVPRPQPS